MPPVFLYVGAIKKRIDQLVVRKKRSDVWGKDNIRSAFFLIASLTS